MAALLRVLRRWAAVTAVVALLGALIPSLVDAQDQSEFSDISDAPEVFVPALEALDAQGVLSGTGCGHGRLCPDEAIARWEVAVWLVRVLDGSDPAQSSVTRFTDVDGSLWWADHAERLAELGVTQGCAVGPARFCPDESVTRAQMAAFLVRAFGLPPADPAGFEDTSGSFAASDIDSLFAAGVTRGCSTEPMRFCPEATTSRAQMAAFLSRAQERTETAVTIPTDDSSGGSAGGGGSGRGSQSTPSDRTSSGTRRSVTTPPSKSPPVATPPVTQPPTEPEVGEYGVPYCGASGTTANGGRIPAPRPPVSLRAVGPLASRSGWAHPSRPLAQLPTDLQDESEESDPDSYRIAVSGRKSGTAILLMNPDGTGATKVTSGVGEYDPDWSPDGTKLLFGRGGDIFVIDADGQNEVQLTDSSTYLSYPQWSPDGTQVLYHRESWAQLYVMNADGTNQRKLVDGHARRAKWSPDGSKILYMGDHDLFVMDADGTDKVKITNTRPIEYHYSWSPDSTKVVYQFQYRIFIANADASGTCELVSSGDAPSWSPDGSTIAFIGGGGVGSISPDRTNSRTLSSRGVPNIVPERRMRLRWSPDSTKLAYATYQGGIYRINLIDVSGGSEMFISGSNEDNRDPAWSPDGARIAFTREQAWHDIYVMNDDGTGRQKLTTGTDDDHSPSFSPDGAKIAYLTDDGDTEIVVMNADGTGASKLTENRAEDEQHVWSPDGAKIAYVTDDGDTEIVVMNADGTGRQQLTTNDGPDTDPAFSPDGTKIVYTGSDGDLEIFVVGVDGTGRVQLTANSYDDGDPAFSPDGAKIAYASEASPGDVEVWVMNADGTGATALTTGTEHSYRPVWSPDGAKIAFTRKLLLVTSVYLMDADGSNLQSVAAAASDAQWSADSSRIAFTSSGGVVVASAADPSQPSRITEAGFADRHPAWSPVASD